MNCAGSRKSIKRVKDYWMPLLKTLGVHVPVILVASKLDLAENTNDSLTEVRYSLFASITVHALLRRKTKQNTILYTACNVWLLSAISLHNVRDEKHILHSSMHVARHGDSHLQDIENYQAANNSI